MTSVAQIGCGYWGPNLLRNLMAHPKARVRLVADVSEQRRAYVERTHPGVRAVADWRQVLADPEIEAVVVSTPASTHHEIARAAILAGKHVFVEKPLATRLDHADELVLLAARAQRTLMVGHTFLYNAAIRYMKDFVASGALGDVFYAYSQRLNLGQVRSDVNAWWNLAPHDVSILLYLRGGVLPASVAAHGCDYLQSGLEDVVFATLTWPDRVQAQIHVSWLDPGKVRRMTIVGSKKMLAYDDLSDDRVAIYDRGIDRVPRVGERMDYDAAVPFRLRHRTGDVLLPRIEVEEPLQVEIAHFLECVTTGATPLTGPKHARDVVAILEAGQRSLASQGSAVAVGS